MLKKPRPCGFSSSSSGGQADCARSYTSGREHASTPLAHRNLPSGDIDIQLPTFVKKSEPAAPAERRVLPMDLQVGDRLADESGEWEVIGRPYTTAGGKTARVRVQRVSAPAVTELRTWGAHERISVKRA